MKLRRSETPEPAHSTTAASSAHGPAKAERGTHVLSSINRPFVVTARGVRLCRPSELVLDILVNPAIGPFTKEDGEVVIDADGKRLR